jgi:hypothetical protein
MLGTAITNGYGSLGRDDGGGKNAEKTKNKESSEVAFAALQLYILSQILPN